MARKLIFVGGLAELETVSEQFGGRLVASSGGGYVFGRYCDATEESDLLWFDIHRCFTRAKLTAKQRYAYKHAIMLEPIAQIARDMGLDSKTVIEHVQAAAKKLNKLGTSGLGCVTVLIENCGGWDQVPGYIEDL